MFKRIILCLVGYVCAIQLYCQSIKLNEPMPDLTVSNVFNYSSDKIRFSDLKGKLVILDFWGFRCSGCIRSFPKMDSLQRMFRDKIQIVMVNPESKDSTRQFFAKRRKLLMPDLPFITSDTILNKLFPHYGVPFHVWIDTSGFVRYFPEPGNTSAWRIEDFLSGKDTEILSKATKGKYVPTFMDTQWASSLNYYSYISTWINGIHLQVTEVKGFVQLSRDNFSVVDLYKTAFSQSTKIDLDRPGRVALEVKDDFKYVPPAKTDRRRNEWLNNYSYNYHLFWPASREGELYTIMQNDLERFFKLKGEIQTRKVKCLVLIRTSKFDKLKTKGGTPIKNFFQSDVRDTIIHSVRILKNQPFQVFASRLETIVEFNFGKPFVDATGYEGNIDLAIDGETLDNITVAVLRKELKKYDLDIVERECPLEVLIIKEN